MTYIWVDITIDLIQEIQTNETNTVKGRREREKQRVTERDVKDEDTEARDREMNIAEGDTEMGWEKWRYRNEDIKNGDKEIEILKRERDKWRNERGGQRYEDIK